MRLKNTLTLLSIGTIVLSTSVAIFALEGDVSNYPATSISVVKDKGDPGDDIITPAGLLYDNTKVSSSNGSFKSTDFSTPSSNGNKINVYFKNTGTATATVTLYKKGWLGFSRVDSFPVDKASEDFKPIAGSKSSDYYIQVTNSNGSTIKGELRARQLD